MCITYQIALLIVVFLFKKTTKTKHDQGYKSVRFLPIWDFPFNTLLIWYIYYTSINFVDIFSQTRLLGLHVYMEQWSAIAKEILVRMWKLQNVAHLSRNTSFASKFQSIFELKQFISASCQLSRLVADKSSTIVHCQNSLIFFLILLICCLWHRSWTTGSGRHTRSKNFKMPFFLRYQKFPSWGNSNRSRTTPKIFFNKYGR